MKKLFPAVILAAFSFFLLGCPGEIPEPDPIPEVKTYTVTYVSEHGNVPEKIEVEENTLLLEKDLPVLTAESFNFKGWFDGETQAIAGTYKVSKDVTLTAKWEKVPAEEPPAEEPPAEEPPAEEPPVEEPPAEEPPVEEPPAEEPPVEEPPLEASPELTPPDYDLPSPNAEGFPFEVGKKYSTLEYEYYDDGSNIKYAFYFTYEFMENGRVLFSENSFTDKDRVYKRMEFTIVPKADENVFYLVPQSTWLEFEGNTPLGENYKGMTTYEQYMPIYKTLVTKEEFWKAVLVQKSMFIENVTLLKLLDYLEKYPVLKKYLNDKNEINREQVLADEETKDIWLAFEDSIAGISDDEFVQYVLQYMIETVYREMYNIYPVPANIPITFETYLSLLSKTINELAMESFFRVRKFEYSSDSTVYKTKEDSEKKENNLSGWKIREVIPEAIDTLEEVIQGGYTFVSADNKASIGKSYFSPEKNVDLYILSASSTAIKLADGTVSPVTISGKGQSLKLSITYKGITTELSPFNQEVAGLGSMILFEVTE